MSLWKVTSQVLGVTSVAERLFGWGSCGDGRKGELEKNNRSLYVFLSLTGDFWEIMSYFCSSIERQNDQSGKGECTNLECTLK